MKRKKLEQKISDASEGLLNASEIRLLEEELKQFPDLLQDYRNIMGLPELSTAYTQDVSEFRNDLHIHRIRKMIRNEQKQIHAFEDITVKWFRKYALAAAVLIVALTSISHLFLQQFGTGVDDMTLPELFYSYEESSAEEYVTYLDEIIEP